MRLGVKKIRSPTAKWLRIISPSIWTERIHWPLVVSKLIDGRPIGFFLDLFVAESDVASQQLIAIG
jgi:hypothetical protein